MQFTGRLQMIRGECIERFDQQISVSRGNNPADMVRVEGKSVFSGELTGNRPRQPLLNCLGKGATMQESSSGRRPKVLN
jgi:hypothetical protein